MPAQEEPKSIEAQHVVMQSFDVPEGFKLHTENSASILLPDTADAFLNPVQEFNRDLSVACIRVWSEDLDQRRKEKWTNKGRGRDRKGKRRAEEGEAEADGDRSLKKIKGKYAFYCRNRSRMTD